MNALCDTFGDKIAILGFISNQFGHQSNGTEDDFVKILKHVRPGGGFELKPQLKLFKKCMRRTLKPTTSGAVLIHSRVGPFTVRCSSLGVATMTGDVNGSNQLPLFRWLKERQKVPFGDAGDSKGNGVDDNDALTQGEKSVLWSPISRGDIAWNFEKFLIGPSGKFVQRYSRFFKIDDIEPDIRALLE